MTITSTPQVTTTATPVVTSASTATVTPTYTNTIIWITSTETLTFTPTLSPTMIWTATFMDTATMTVTPTVTITQAISGNAATSMTKTASAACAALNDMVTYSISFINVGAVTINNYTVWDSIPAQMNVSEISGGGNNTGNVINWTYTALAPGNKGSVTWTGIVISDTDNITNTAMDSAGTMSSASFTICTPTNTFTSVLTQPPTATITQTMATLTSTPVIFTATVTPTITPTLVVEPTPPNEQMPCQSIALLQNIIYPGEGKYMSIHYSLYKQMAVVIKVYNRNGTLVKTAADDQENGDINIAWDGTNDSGQTVSSGIYLLYMKLGQCERTEKVAVIR